MYFNILKRDLKRKKTMNIILLLFTILAAMFVASGLNNVVTVMNGTDYFLDKAGVRDYMVFTQNGDGGVESILEQSDNVEGFVKEECFWTSTDDVTHEGKKIKAKNNTMLIQSMKEDEIHFFLKDNQVLKKVNPGETYLTAGVLKKNNLHIGDLLKVKYGNTDMTFKIAGEIKDALLGSDMMGNTRMLISDEDYQVFKEDESLVPYLGNIFYIETGDVSSLSSELTKASNILFSGARSMIKLSYVMDMIVAMIVLVLSICLIIVSFVILRFVISFTIHEEFREIGVMKAIGISNFKIRSLYMTKYLAMSLVGGIIGFFASIPFGNMMIKSVSEKMYLGNDGGYLLSVFGACIVIVMMGAFAYFCTGKVKKSTPVDAIRNGQTGERYRKKNYYRLSKAHASNPLYMAINDVLSAPRRFLTIMLSYFLCSIFVLGVVLVTDTMKSKNLVTSFGTESDVYITDSKLIKMNTMGKTGDEQLEDKFKELERDLKEAGMPGTVSMEVWYKYPCEVNGKLYSVIFQKNAKTSASDYEYIEGTPPQNDSEIAITPMVAEQIGAHIGDRVTIDFGSEKKECMVVAYFQTLNQLGQVARLHEDAPTSMEYSNALMSFQINFNDHPDEKEIESRIEKIKDMYGIEGVYDAAEYCVDCIGVVDTLESVSFLLLCITGIVVILVTVLMERTFISDETGQIALLKSIGFQNSVIIKWHVYRFMIVAGIAELLAVILTIPVTKLWCNPIWKMMGMPHVNYYFNPLTLVVIYPGSILLVTLAALWLTTLYTRKINSSDIVNVE